jgi:hypothetical protein
MYQGQTVFSQLMDFLPRHSFRQCVTRYQGNYRMRSFSCYDQFLCMAFAQLTLRESLRDIECCLGALEEKLYHAGFRGHVSRSTLACATSENAVKTQIWIAVAVYVLVAIVKKRMQIGLSLYTILQILSLTLFEKTPLYQAFAQNVYRNKIATIDNQLKLFDP